MENKTMTNKDFGIAANKMMFFIYNFPCKVMEVAGYDGPITKSLPSFFEVFNLNLRAHLAGKWNSNYETYGSYGVFPAFYGELDNHNRAKVLKWINENYAHNENWGISIPTLEEE